MLVDFHHQKKLGEALGVLLETLQQQGGIPRSIAASDRAFVSPHKLVPVPATPSPRPPEALLPSPVLRIHSVLGPSPQRHSRRLGPRLNTWILQPGYAGV